MNRTILRTFTWLLFLGLCVASGADAQLQYFTGKGSAVVIEGDRLAATKLAYIAARKKAVNKAMKSMVRKGSKDEMNFNLKKAQLLKGPFDFIREENQISNSLSGTVLTIMLKIGVDREELSQFLGKKGILASQSEERKRSAFPSVMVMVTEELSGQINNSPYSAAVINQTLLDNRFDVVDEKVVGKSIQHDQAVQALLNNDPHAAQAMALQYGSGMLITGRAVVQPSAMQSGGMQSYGANITLKAIEADTGRVVAVVSADDNYPHVNMLTGSRKAVEGAAKKAAAGLIEQLSIDFETTSETVEVTVSNITYTQLAVLKKILKRDFPELTAIKQKNFNGHVAKLDLTVEKSTAGFVDSLAMKDFGTFILKVSSFSPNKIDCSLKMKEN